MTNQKIGILTFHRCINYGSYWQARCLAEGIRAKGYQAEILDYYSHRVDIAEWKCALQPVLPTPVPPRDKPLYRKKINAFFKAFESLPLSRRFPLDEPALMDEYDTVVIGSDEVWNLHHPWFKDCDLFFGDNLKAKKRISYAASFGNYSAWWGLDAEWGEKISRLDSLSVRDENSRALVVHTTGLQPAVVLDPCLQFPISVVDNPPGILDVPYALVYGHNFSDYFALNVKKWAKNKGLRLISVGYRNDWADEQWLTASPFDFTLAMKHAEAVATNFFHGCVFALKNKKPFVCEKSAYRSIKVPDLMQQLGSERHLMDERSDASQFDARLSAIPEERIFNRISDLQRISNDYLENALSTDMQTSRYARIA